MRNERHSAALPVFLAIPIKIFGYVYVLCKISMSELMDHLSFDFYSHTELNSTKDNAG